MYVASIRDLFESSFRRAAITVKKKFGSWTREDTFPVNEVQKVASGGKCSDVLGKETSFNWFADLSCSGVMVNPVSSNYCIPIVPLYTINPVRGYNIRVVD